MTTQKGDKGDPGAQGIPGVPVAIADPVVAYRLGQVEIAVKEGFKLHDEKLTELTSHFATETSLQGVETRVASLESDRMWLVRLVVGSVVFAVLALIGVGFKLNR